MKQPVYISLSPKIKSIRISHQQVAAKRRAKLITTFVCLGIFLSTCVMAMYWFVKDTRVHFNAAISTKHSNSPRVQWNMQDVNITPTFLNNRTRQVSGFTHSSPSGLLRITPYLHNRFDLIFGPHYTAPRLLHSNLRIENSTFSQCTLTSSHLSMAVQFHHDVIIQSYSKSRSFFSGQQSLTLFFDGLNALRVTSDGHVVGNEYCITASQPMTFGVWDKDKVHSNTESLGKETRGAYLTFPLSHSSPPIQIHIRHGKQCEKQII